MTGRLDTPERQVTGLASLKRPFIQPGGAPALGAVSRLLRWIVPERQVLADATTLAADRAGVLSTGCLTGLRSHLKRDTAVGAHFDNASPNPEMRK